jgi:hypothetical protein
MANKQSSRLMTLGKRMLGFSASSSGCCAGPAATDGKAPETATDTVASPKPGEGSAAAASCCSTAPVGERANPSA